jgi:hypothetical protein
MLKAIFTRGEQAVWSTASELAKNLGVIVCPKIRIADVAEIQNSGISADLYSYALRAHFDVLLVRDNRAALAIEFDGPGHEPDNDARKNALCDRFRIPLVRVHRRHIAARNFDDDAVSFLIQQLFCVEFFISRFGNDPYEPYDPLYFASIPGTDRPFPFAYSQRWRNRLFSRLKQHADRFPPHVQEYYAHGLVNLGSFEGTWQQGGNFRSISGLRLGDNHGVWGSAALDFEVHGLDERKLQLFMELSTFVEGLAAAEMFEKAVVFLDDPNGQVPALDEVIALTHRWERDGFRVRRGFNLPGPPMEQMGASGTRFTEV